MSPNILSVGLVGWTRHQTNLSSFIMLSIWLVQHLNNFRVLTWEKETQSTSAKQKMTFPHWTAMYWIINTGNTVQCQHLHTTHTYHHIHQRIRINGIASCANVVTIITRVWMIYATGVLVSCVPVTRRSKPLTCHLNVWTIYVDSMPYHTIP